MVVDGCLHEWMEGGMAQGTHVMSISVRQASNIFGCKGDTTVLEHGKRNEKSAAGTIQSTAPKSNQSQCHT